MTKIYEIVLRYIKDLSVEIPNAETFIFSREYITKYSLGIKITTNPLKDEMIASKCGWTPFNNYKVKGFPVGTIVNGILVMSDGKILVESKGKPLSF